MKRIDVDGLSYRVRRGRLVQIPPEWVSRTVTEQTLRQRKDDRRRGVRRRVWFTRRHLHELCHLDPEGERELGLLAGRRVP